MKNTPLDALTVKNSTSEGKPLRKVHDGQGLYLWVYDDGTKYWRFRYYWAGKEKSLSVGVYPKISLADARKKRDELLKLIGEGTDPGIKRKTDKVAKALNAANTVEAVGEEWYSNQLHTWSASHALDVRRRLDANIYPTLGKWPIADLTAPIILDAVRKVEQRGASDLSHRVMGMIGQILRYGISTGRGTHDHTLDLKGSLKPHVKRNQPAVAEKQLPQLLWDIAQYDSPPFNGDVQIRLALQALALTFVRTSELIGATWDEFDFDKALWEIPAARMKMKKSHVVPLSAQALQVFEALKGIAGKSPWVLPGRNPVKPISNNSMLFALYRLGYRGEMTGHGFRSVASTALNESNLFESDWIERQLAHSPANEVAGAYNKAKYLPARKKMMAWYASFLDEQAGGNMFEPLPLKG